MRSDIVPGAVFPDYELPDHTNVAIVIHNYRWRLGLFQSKECGNISIRLYLLYFFSTHFYF